MAAPAVGVDRVAEWHRGPLGHLVDDAACPHVQELEAPELACADLALRQVEQGRLRTRPGVE
jgi:hypothetical protein